MNREALDRGVKRINDRATHNRLVLAEDVADMIEAALSPEVEQPWQPTVGEMVEVIETGECGETKDVGEHGFNVNMAKVALAIRHRERWIPLSELRPASIAPGDFVLVDGTKTGMVTPTQDASKGWMVLLSGSDGWGQIAESRLTLLLKGRK